MRLLPGTELRATSSPAGEDRESSPLEQNTWEGGSQTPRAGSSLKRLGERRHSGSAAPLMLRPARATPKCPEWSHFPRQPLPAAPACSPCLHLLPAAPLFGPCLPWGPCPDPGLGPGAQHRRGTKGWWGWEMLMSA